MVTNKMVGAGFSLRINFLNPRVFRTYLKVATAALRARDIDRKLLFYYQRILKRKGKGIAKVALARKIAT
ncbi:MAG: hypothetical protein ABIL86_06330, partial [candidate division WOR-3 bacterium]